MNGDYGMLRSAEIIWEILLISSTPRSAPFCMLVYFLASNEHRTLVRGAAVPTQVVLRSPLPLLKVGYCRSLL